LELPAQGWSASGRKNLKKSKMPITKKDLKDIKGVVTEAVDPYFGAIKKDFNHIDNRFDKVDKRLGNIELLLSVKYQRRIEILEKKVKRVEELLAMR